MPEFGLNSWTTGEAASAPTDVRVAAAAGYQHIELRDGKLERHMAAGGSLADLRERIAEAGLRVLSVNTLDDSTLHEGERLEALVERCHTLAAWAAALDCPQVIIGPSYLSDGRRDVEAIRGRTVEALARHAAAAAEHGVRIAFEYHGYAGCSINNLADARAVLDMLGDARVGLVIDAFHFYVGNSSFDELERFDGARIFIAHLADVDHADRATLRKPNRVLPGDGVLPVRDLIGCLRRAGYRGPYSLELFNEALWALDPMIVAKRGLRSMRRLFP
jgi:2-keto-myo-inositol isomerase